MDKITWLSLLKEAKPYKKEIALGQFIALFAAIISLPIPLLFPILIDEVLLGKPGKIMEIIDAIISPQNSYIYILIVLFTTLFLRFAFFVLNVIQSKLFTTISKTIIFKIRDKLLNHLKDVSIAEYEALGGGGVGAKLVTDINTVDSFIGISIGRFIVSLLSLIGVAAVLLIINWQLALIILTINPMVIILTVFLGRRIKKLKKSENQKIEDFQESLTQTIDLFIQIRTHNQENRYINSMIENARAIKESSLNFGWKSEAAGFLSSLVFLYGFEIFRAIAMIMVLFSSLSIGEMLAVMGYLWFMVSPLQEIMQIIFSYHNANSALERLNAVLALDKEPKYPHINNPFLNTNANEIHLENICFSYKDKEVLHNINMTIPKGKTVALLGPSGSGKTTLAHIILGLYPVCSGKIYIDNTPVNQIGLDVIRENVSLVLQSPKMFNDTLRHNLTFGKKIEDEKLFQALQTAQLETVISKLTNGLDTKIGK
ncbi:MAG: ATP-binding cassette, subfamily bacterial, partial [Campylobacterota bacterium]|nr:ATP-binding cassette, subfamily bacterial [Campylobacterota bacterium]